MRIVAVVLGMVVAAAPVTAAAGAIKTEAVVYTDHGDDLQGFFAWDDGVTGMRPAVLVVHDWRGHGEYVRERARQLAALGYLAFACDIYGKGVYAEAPAEASKLAAPYRENRPLMRRRVHAGLVRMVANPMADADHCGAIGYCFGGTTVLEMIRAAEPLKAAVIFHGGLDAKEKAKPGGPKTHVLVCQGGADAYTLPALPDLEAELTHAGLDWEVDTYADAVHAFTIREAGNDPSKGSAYNELADRRSWAAMQAWFAQTLR